MVSLQREPVDLGLGVLEFGALEDLPVSEALHQCEVMCASHVQDLGGSARGERTGAQEYHRLIGDGAVERLAKSYPVLGFEPSHVSGASHSVVASSERLRLFLLPDIERFLKIERASLEVDVAFGKNFDASSGQVSVEGGDGSHQDIPGFSVREGRGADPHAQLIGFGPCAEVGDQDLEQIFPRLVEETKM